MWPPLPKSLHVNIFIFRNNLVLAWEYRADGLRFVLGRVRYLGVTALKILLFEQARFRKLLQAARGVGHALTGRMGPFAS